jgi:hypothetical protein
MSESSSESLEARVARLEDLLAINQLFIDYGEHLQAGVRDMRVTLDANGFDVIDDVPVEELRPRYGLAPLPRHYPARIVTALKRLPTA